MCLANPGPVSYLDTITEPAISIIAAQELIVGARNKLGLAAIDSLVSAYSTIHIDASIGRLAYDLLKRYAKSVGSRACTLNLLRNN